MPNKSKLSVNQQAAVKALEEAFSKSKAAGLPLSVYSGGVTEESKLCYQLS